MFQTYRPRHRAAGALLGMSGLLPIAIPAGASAATTQTTVAAAPAAPHAVAAATHRAVNVSRPKADKPYFPLHPLTHDVVIHNPFVAKDRLARGWTLVPAPAMKVVCNGPSVAGRVPNTYSCMPAASYAVACFAKPGHTDVVACVVDPRRKLVSEFRTRTPLKPTGLPAMAIRRPVGALMSTGTYCRLASSGVAVRPHEKVVSWGGCEDGARTRLWQNPDGNEQWRQQGPAIQYRAGTEKAGSPLEWTTVSVRYWIG